MLSIEFNDGPQDPRRLATEMFEALLSALGAGTHHLVCTVLTPEGALSARTMITQEGGKVTAVFNECASFCVALAVGVSPTMSGGIATRTRTDNGSEIVRGWELTGGWARALNSAEVFDAYCTDPHTGEAIPPEPGVDYRAGIPLPHPRKRVSLDTSDRAATRTGIQPTQRGGWTTGRPALPREPHGLPVALRARQGPQGPQPTREVPRVMTESRQLPYSQPLTEAESEEIGEFVGLIVAACASAVADKTGLSRTYLYLRFTRGATVSAVALEFLRAIEEGQSKVEAAATAGRWLLETTNQALRETHARAAARNAPPAA